MRDFNLIVTQAADGHYQRLLRELSRHGEFHRTEFLGVVLGRVTDPAAFLEAVRSERRQAPDAFPDLGRVVPLDRCFIFTADTFADRLREALLPCVEQVTGRSFYVRLERRGLKGHIVSPEVERSLDSFLLERVAGSGGTARIGFDDPDLIVVIETIGDRCGVGLLTRATREAYPFVRVP